MTPPGVMVRLGWLLFLLGSVVFLVDAIRLRDAVTAAGSLLFVFGVIAFLAAERLPTRCPSCRRALIEEPRATPALCDECRTSKSHDELHAAITALAWVDRAGK